MPINRVRCIYLKKIPYKLILVIIGIISVLLFKKIMYQNSVTETVNSTLENRIESDYNNGNFSGSVLVAQNGKVVFEKSYGMADYENKVPNTVDTTFRIGSVTKQFTAMSIMMLEEKGFLDINDKVNKYIPDYPAGDEITIQNLLTMSSGIPNNMTDLFPEYDVASGNYDSDKAILKDEHLTPSQLINLFKNKPLNFKPGEKFEYSNSNYIILGYIIEKISNMSYEDFLKKNIFIPLDMKNSGYDNNEVLSNKAIGYDKISPKPVKTFSWDMSLFFSCGGLYSTVEDLYKWDQALYTEKLVKKETLAKIFKSYTKITGDTGYSYCSYGYGWIVQDLAQKPIVEHNGVVPGFLSYIYRNESTKKTIIVLCNNFGAYPKYPEFCNALVTITNSSDSVK